MGCCCSSEWSPIKGTFHLTYDHDWDTNGLFYFLGTCFGETPWKNPAFRNQVQAISSSTGFESGGVKFYPPIYQLFERDHQDRYFLGSVNHHIPNKNPAYEFCIGIDRGFVPKRYTLVLSYPRTKFSQPFPTDWILQGRVDEEGDWITLHEHNGNELKESPKHMHTFECDSVPVPNTRGYSWFRLEMTRPNTNNVMTFPLSGLEMYGALTQD